jgi:hypothetical protein
MIFTELCLLNKTGIFGGVSMQKMLISTAIFSAAGLLGPIIRFGMSLYQKYDSEVSISIYNFIYSLVIYTWPAQPFAIMDINIGWFPAYLIATGLNVILFGFLGLIVALFANSKTHIISVYVFICGLVFIFAFWGAGFSIFYVNWYAFIMALLLYAIPFYVVGVIRDSAH